MADNVSIFLAGNRKLNKTDLENTLVAGIEPYIETYQNTWGKENTQAVRLAYSQLINAIHDDKVSMNIDGSLHVSDGSIYNSPDKKGFDPVAKAAYFVTSIINRMSDYKEPEKEVKKYGTDLFAKNFVNYLAPPNSGVDISNLWANLDDEVEDDKGNRSRPYTNRLAYFNKFLDLEIANLNNYDEVDEYWGSKDAFKNQLIDLRLRLSDNDISKEDTMMLAKLGLGPSFFDTTGTPLTEEELLKREELRLADEAKLKEEQAKKAAQILANRGILGREIGVLGPDALNNTAAYEEYLAKTYGTGEKGFNAINNQIWALLEKASDDNSSLSNSEKRQLGNFIAYIQEHNPAFMNQQLDPVERADLKTHGNFINQDAIRLPWTTRNGRYVYADKSGNVYFLKPNNQVKFDYKYGVTDNEYKKNFLKLYEGIANGESPKAFSSESKVEDYARIASFLGDVVSLGGGLANVLGTGTSLIGDAIADAKSNEDFKTILWHALQNVGYGIVGLIPGTKLAKFTAKWGKQANYLMGALASYGIISEGGYTYNMLNDLLSGKKKSITSEDLKHLTQLGRATTGGVAVGRSAAARNKYGDLTQEVHQVTTAKGEKVNLTAKQRAEVEKIGNSKGQKAANEKFKEHAEANGTKIKEGDGLKEGTFKEKPTKLDLAKARRIPYTQKRPGGNRLEAERQTVINPEQRERFETLSKIREQNKGRWNPREFGWGRGKDNPGAFFDKYVKGVETPKTSTTPKSATTDNVSNAEIKLLQNSPVPRRIEKINEFVQTDNPEKIRAARQLFENTKALMHPDLVNAINKRIADAELRVQKQANAQHTMRQALENNKKAENLLKSGGIDASVSRARSYIKGLPKLSPLLEKLIGKTTWKLMATSPEFKKLTRNLKLVLERAYNMLFEKRGGKLYKHQLGGIILVYQGGGVAHNQSTRWKNLVFDAYIEELLNNLNLGGHKYAKWVNSMLTRHSGLYNLAKKLDFLTTPWRHETVGSYQTDYRENSLAPYPWETEDGKRIGYNIGIRNAARNNRYKVASSRPTSGDSDNLNYVSDSLYSGETDDRRILGREGDFTEEELNALNERLKANGNFFAYLDKDKYYKLGFYDDNGNRRVFTDTGDTAYIPQDVNKLQQSGISFLDPLVNPKIKVPEKIDILSDIRKRQGIWGEGTDLNKNKFDVDDLVQKGLINGLATGSLVGTIATNNKNFELLRKARRRVNLDDYAPEYYVLTGDYAGNQVANNQAAEVEKVANTPKTSNAALNAALALEGVIKAGNIRQQQAIRDLDHRQQRQSLIEQAANKNRALRVATANKNAETLYNIEQQIASDEQDKNLGNWTSINNFINQGIYDAKTEYATRRQIKDAWAANLLGTRQDYIRQALNMDGELQQLREEFKKDQNNTELASKIRNLTSERIYTYGTLWDLLYAQQYGLQYNGPRYSKWDMFQRYGILYARGGKLTPEEIYIREDNRNRRANADRFMKTIWKAIDVYLKQKNSK